MPSLADLGCSAEFCTTGGEPGLHSHNQHVQVVMRFGADEWQASPFSVQARPKRLLEEAGRHFEIPRAAERARLRRESDGQVMPSTKRLLDLGLSDGEVLEIEIPE
jgi:hypothetical protein